MLGLVAIRLRLVYHHGYRPGGASENNSVKGALADGMYDSNKNFRYLSKKHIKPGIKTRRNSKVRATNCQARNMSVIRQQKNLKMEAQRELWTTVDGRNSIHL